jgi:hypothetical protein
MFYMFLILKSKSLDTEEYVLPHPKEMNANNYIIVPLIQENESGDPQKLQSFLSVLFLCCQL